MKKIGEFPEILRFAAAFLFSLLMLLPSYAPAEPAINVAAVVSPRHIRFGEKARLDLTISGKTFIKHIEAPRFNFLPAFLAVPLASETTPRLETDKIAVSMTWAYELIPQAIGDFTLSDIRFAYEGTPYFANPGAIRVSGTDTYIDATTKAVHEVAASVDPAEPYLNALVTYRFQYLYTAVLPTREPPTPRLPSFPGFRSEPPTPLPAETQQIRGKTFWVETQTCQLYPQETGQLVIEPAELLLPLRSGQRTLRTAPIQVRVRPLPIAGKPAGFSGAIGTYQISAQVSQNTVETGQAFTLSVRIAGRGNIATLTAPQIPRIPGVIVNGPAATDTSTPTSRNYVYAVIPSQTGVLRIPAIVYTYFDPSRAVYATTQTAPIPVSVRLNPNSVAETEAEGGGWTLWILLFIVLLVALIAGGFFWYRAGFVLPFRQQQRSEARLGNQDSETGEADPVTPLSHARAALAGLAAESPTTFASTLAQTLYQYLEGTLTLPQRNIEGARQACTDAGIAAPAIAELVDLLTTCDYHRFAPVELDSTERDALIARAESVINAIETHQRIL